MLITVKVFAFLSLLFVPSILLVLGLGYLVRDTMNGFFGLFGIAVFMTNLVYVFTGERRVRLWRKLQAIAGMQAQG